MVRGDHVRSIAWQIEQYLKAMLERASNGVIEVQRSALSELFNCAPSQINYVLSTRFHSGSWICCGNTQRWRWVC